MCYVLSGWIQIADFSFHCIVVNCTVLPVSLVHVVLAATRNGNHDKERRSTFKALMIPPPGRVIIVTELTMTLRNVPFSSPYLSTTRKIFPISTFRWEKSSIAQFYCCKLNARFLFGGIGKVTWYPIRCTCQTIWIKRKAALIKTRTLCFNTFLFFT